jgi:hypothetical protein
MNDALARIFNIYLRTKRRTPKRKDDGPNIWVCVRAPQLPRYLFIQGMETRTVQVEKEARESTKNGSCR